MQQNPVETLCHNQASPAGAHSTKATVCADVSTPARYRMATSGSSSSSGRPRPVAGSTMRSRCAAMVVSSLAGGPRVRTALSSSSITTWYCRIATRPRCTLCKTRSNVTEARGTGLQGSTDDFKDPEAQE